MKGTATPETPQQMTMRWLRRLCFVFLFAVVGLIGLFLLWRVDLSVRTNRSLAHLRQAGYPVSFAGAAQKYYPEIPSNQNAALFFERAFALLPGTNDPEIPIFPYYQSTNRAAFLSQKNLADIGDFVVSNHACLDFLRQSPVATNCRYPVKFNQWDEILVPHLAKIKGAALLLSLEASVRTRNGDTASAIEDLNAIFRLCHSLDGEPLLSSQQVRLALINILNHTLEEILNTQPFADAQLLALSTDFQKCREPNIMTSATAMEFCTWLEFFNLPGAGLTTDSMPTALQTNPLLPQTENMVYKSMKTAGFSATDHALLLEAMEKELKVVRLPFPQRLDSAREVTQWVEAQGHHSLLDYGFSASASSITEKVQYDVATGEARLNIIHAILAIERYRLAATNPPPDNLSALVPSMLEAVPLDPFDGKPLRYKKLARGYMVYSIGPNRKDDVGIPSYGVRTSIGYSMDEAKTKHGPRMWRPPPGTASTNSPQWDLTFVVER